MLSVRAIVLCCLLALCAVGAAFASAPADATVGVPVGVVSGAAGQMPSYPFANRYKATVYGTPPDYRYTLPAATLDVVPEVRSIKIAERRVPELFWYCDAMEYSVMLQKREAPLIFIIAGTGARHNSSKVRFLQNLFYSAGYHTIGVSSPTHFNFIVSMSKHGLSGYVPYDVDDLHTLLGWIKSDVEASAKVSGYSITGYSLGALHAAFLAERDSREKRFNFEKVLLINPPVDLFNSALVFDSWLRPNGDGGGPQQAVTKFIERFSEFYQTNHLGRLDSEVLYRFFRSLDVSDEELKQIIGVGFRITASSMVFTSDACLDAGYIIPAGTKIPTNEPLLPYFIAASHVSFEEYFSEFLLPYIQTRDAGMTREGALAACSLLRLEGYLRSAANVRLIGNEDDPILSAREVAFLKDVFGGRGVLFPLGGHCGNLQYGPFAAKALELVRR